MAQIRFNALQTALQRDIKKVEEAGRRSELFGKHVFNDAAMRQYLTSDA